MKILMVNKFLYPRGGSESYMLKLGKQLEKSGHEVEYFGMYDEKNTVGNSAEQYTGNMDFHTSSPGRLLYPFRIIYSADAYKKIGRVLDSFKPDIVHMNNINFQLTPSIIYAVKKRNIPLVQTVHDYQMICPNHLLYNFSECKACTRCVDGSRWNCLRYRCIHASGIKSLLGVIEGTLYSALGTYRLIDLYICPSRFLEKKLLAANSFYSGKTYTVHNFISKLKPDKCKEEKEPYIVFVGRLSGEKGVELLAKAAGMLPGCKFVVAGNGPDEAVLHGLKNIHLAGFLGGAELARVIASARALIAPSICYENCPLSILEAHSMGVPVITMDSGGMAELVEDGVTGILIRKPEPDCVAEAVRRVMDDKEFCGRLRENCEKQVENILSVEDYCDIMLGKYHELIARRQSV